jgi:HEAT repeat protein
MHFLHRRRQPLSATQPLSLRHRPTVMRLTILLAALTAFTATTAPATSPPAIAEIVPPVVDDIMWQDPYLSGPTWLPKFSDSLVPLWLQALDRPDAETRRVAAGTFAIAATRAMPGLEPGVTPLRQILSEDDDPVVRRAAAAALVAMDAKDAADALRAAATNDGLLMAEIVEPALAEWGVAAAHEMWMARLTDPRCEPALQRLAIESLATAGVTAAVEPLLATVVDDSRPLAVRVASARACGTLQASGLVDTANDLANRKLRPQHAGPLLAALLLTRHDTPAAHDLLTTLASDPEPAVATVALDRLREIDNTLALPLAGAAIASADAGLRKLGGEILIAQGDATAVAALCPLLDDRNPDVRGMVAGSLIDFATSDSLLTVGVLDGTMAVLSGTGWRGLEQASLVLGTLDHEPAADRLLELMHHERPEAAIAAAWALRKLSVDATLAPLLTFAEEAQEVMAGPGAPWHVGLQVSQVFQFYGEVLYAPAEPLMRKFIPKSTLLPEARGAACWTLGHLKASEPDEDLARAFAARLADVGSPDPESDLVRTMAAISLGRMKSESQLSTLRTFAEQHGPVDTVGLGCLWAIEQITGEPMETIETLFFGVSGWFLQPQLR